MAARAQATCYPDEALQAGQNSNNGGVCSDCNSNDKLTCAGYIRHPNTAAGNICHDQVQAYCTAYSQFIKDHTDVGPYTSICEAKDELITKNWTADWWNDYEDDLLTADKMGQVQKHDGGVTMTPRVADPCSNAHPGNSLIEGSAYTELVTGLGIFQSTIPSKATDDVIKAAEAVALHTGYDNAKFNTNVCDICNTRAQNDAFGCDCNCSCTCTFVSVGPGSGGEGCCGCSCFCSCECSCDCPQSCTCDCACGSPGN